MEWTDLEAHTREAQLKVANAIGALMEFWGFRRAMGRVWTALYLSPDPLGAAALGERLQMSAGAVSMTLADLQRWGTVRRSFRPGERREYFEAETSVWKMVTRVWRERELGLVRDTAEAFGAADRLLAARAATGDKQQRRHVAHVRERLAKLRRLARLGETLLDTIVAGQAIDPAPLRLLASAIGEAR